MSSNEPTSRIPTAWSPGYGSYGDAPTEMLPNPDQVRGAPRPRAGWNTGADLGPDHPGSGIRWSAAGCA